MTSLPLLQPRSSKTDTDLARELSAAVEGEVRFDLHNRMLYATDASLYQVEPLGVVIPSSVDDAVRAAEFCAGRGLPILPRGGGTSLAGQCTNRAVVIDFSANCRAVKGVAEGGRECEVEPGITIDDLNEALAKRGVFFAPDPATSKQCNIGGAIGNNAAGGRSILYGRTSESLLAVDALLVDALASPERLTSGTGGTGRRARLEAGAAARDPFVRELTLRVAEVVRRHERLIRERFPKTIRRNAGYSLDLILRQMDSAGANADSDAVLNAINLAHLVCGSEGTLAVTLGARLKLNPLPRRKGLAVIGLSSLDEAIGIVPAILQTGPSAVELLDDTIIDLASANAEYRRYVELMPRPDGGLRAVLYVEYFEGGTWGETERRRDEETEGEIAGKFAALRGLVARLAPSARVAEYSDAKSMGEAWKLRKAGEPLLHGMPGDRKPITFVEDNAVPVERLSDFVREFRRIVRARGTNAAFWAHASVGVLHVRPFLDIRDEGDRERMREIAVEVSDLARSMGGVMSGEHGDGKARGPLLERFYGPELMRAFGEIKAIFDPRNLLNPGNIVAPGPVASIAESLRVKPDGGFVQVPGVETYFDYEGQHGFRGAVEMCNGAGVCRKKSGGTMCPSYMASLDERHSTRGRGNALRLAITGQLGAAWSDPGTLETLDLCLSCKGCKTECPSNVDIARLKAEYLAQGYRESGRVPLKARVFGHVRALNRLGSIAPGVANWVNRLPVTRWVLGKALGFARQRSVPEFGRALTARVMDSRDGVGSARPDVAGEALPQTPPSGRGTERALPGESGVRSAAVEETLPQPPPSGRGTERARPGESGARSAAVEETLPQPPPLGRGSEETGQHAPRAGLTAMDGTLPQPPPSGRGTEKGVAGDGASASGSAPTVVVFGDCFTTYNEPRIGLAAKRVLEAFGYRVRFVNAGCCGRAMISTGLLADAIGTIDATLERLGPVIEDQSVRAVVVCEPSCLSAIKDDWLELKVRTPRAVREKLAGKSWLVEEFLEREWGKHPRTPVVGKAQAEGPRCVLHGHCHQKALWGVGSSAGLLKRLLGDVQVLDSGCCGMAGSFGYTQEHYDLSMRIGELVLFPAVRESAGACVVAPGTSCRHQIRDGTGVEAVHPIEVVARVLGV